MKRLNLLFAAFCFFSIPLNAQEQPSINGVDAKGKFYPLEWNTIMMESTYRIEGQSATVAGKQLVGTGFVMGVPIEDGLKDPTKSRPVLITAQHVLAGITGEFATLDMRIFENGAWTETKVPIRIRNKNSPLWVHHPIADVAVLERVS